MDTIGMIQKVAAMDIWWWAASLWQHACSCITSHAEIFGKTSNHPGDLATLQPGFCALWLLAFPKTKITFEREKISDVIEIRENMTGQLIAIVRSMWGPNVPSLMGTEASLSYVRCFLYLVSSSVNLSIFHITWLDNFWIDLVYTHQNQKTKTKTNPEMIHLKTI